MKVLLCLLLAAVVCVYAEDEETLTLTPFGYMPRSCVHGVPDGAHVDYLEDGNLKVAAKGQSYLLPPCHTNEHVLARSVAKSRSSLPTGWAAYAYWNTQSAITSYVGTWSVPPRPSDQQVQTLFLFTGLQNEFDFDASPQQTISIIQPVLQWGPSEAGGGSYWSIASWYVTSTGQAVYSTLQQVSSGHTIFGNMTIVGAKWDIITVDVNTKVSTAIHVNPGASEMWAFVTLEVYNVNSCGDYPNGSTEFKSLVMTSQGQRQTPNWSVSTQPGCNEAVKIVSTSDVKIKF